MHATRVAFPHSLCHEAARRAGPKPFSTPVLLQWFRVQVSALHWQTLFSPKRLVVVSRLCRQSHLGKVVATCLWRLHLASHGFPTVVDSFTQLALVMWAFVHSRIFWDGSRHWGGVDAIARTHRCGRQLHRSVVQSGCVRVAPRRSAFPRALGSPPSRRSACRPPQALCLEHPRPLRLGIVASGRPQMCTPDSLAERALCVECEQVFLRGHMFAFGYGGLCVDCALVGAPRVAVNDGMESQTADPSTPATSATSTGSLEAQGRDTCNQASAPVSDEDASSSDSD